MMNLLFAVVVLAAVIGSQYLIMFVTEGEMNLGYKLAVVIAPITEEVGRLVCPLSGIVLGVFEFCGYGFQRAIAVEKLTGNSRLAVTCGVVQGTKNLLLHLGFAGVLLGLGGGLAGFSACLALHALNNLLGVWVMIDTPFWIHRIPTALQSILIWVTTLMCIPVALLGAYLYFW